MSLHGTRSGEASLKEGPESVKSEPPLGPVEAFLKLWFAYESGVISTPLGHIYGSEFKLDKIRRSLDVRSSDERVQAYHDAQNYFEIKTLYRMGYIKASPELIDVFNSEKHEE